jgi:methyltransferase family protein
MSMSTSPFEKQLILQACLEIKAKRILEIGVFKGETTALLAAAVAERGGQVLGIDPMNWAAEWLGNGVRRHLPPTVSQWLEGAEQWMGVWTYERQFWGRVGDASNVSLIKAFSTDPDLLASADPRLREFDLVFIDGDHSYAGARSDLEHWASRVRVGGRVLVHDATARFKGVCRALEEWSIGAPVEIQWPKRDSLCELDVVGPFQRKSARAHPLNTAPAPSWANASG